ncbi:PD-(D/E)XK nuclease family protein [Candidatus Kaiserbacteria bacterium]|nr:PD-(D/E)XK nuclease family protein [Candidatus Kaiserbacteria bacterium]
MADFTKRYNPNRSADWNYGGKKWKLSRSKIDFFIECPRCFYVDNKLGTKRPGMPSFNLNIAVDELFKKEFDHYRKEQKPHPLMEKYAIEAVPFAHKDLDTWRDNFQGITYNDPGTGLTVSGAIDDVWQKPDGSLIVVDYKSTSKAGTIETLSDSSWEAQYKRQIGVYQWLLEQNGFTVDSRGYFVYANASKDEPGFNDTLMFETTLVPCDGDSSWIPDTLRAIQSCLESEEIPASGEACEYCPYREAAGKKLLALHQKSKR